jgi:transposase-like protein
MRTKVVPGDTTICSCLYLNNLVEQYRRGTKSRTGTMLGFKRFDYAAIVITGIELARKIQKDQFKFQRFLNGQMGDVHDL